MSDNRLVKEGIMRSLVVVGLVLVIGSMSLAGEPGRFEFTRMIAHWAEYADPDYLKFVAEARPEVVQVGFYGGHFWSLAHTPYGKGYPAHFPVQGLQECGEWFKDLNSKLHQNNVKIIGHFNVEFLVGDPDSKEGPRGFFKFYRDLWDEKELGPRPVRNPLELLERDGDGNPLVNNSYSIGGMKEYWGCLNNPQWRQVLKAWVKVGIKRGVDGFISNYFYRHNCLCPHCVADFKTHLSERYTPELLRAQWGITDLKNHQFKELVSWHDPKESTPLRREMLRFSQIATKRAFDEVFIQYGRSLKPDLILAQWNHLGDFNQINGDERCLLPAELWGKGEDYLWYSTGGSACYTDLQERWLGEGTLQARYIRGAFDDKPFTLGKYESTRTRVAIAELVANGGAPMGFYTRFRDPLARQEIVRYYRFLAENDGIFRANRPQSEVLLLFPRKAVHAGEVARVEEFKRLGRQMLDEHILFDVRPDDMVSEDDKSQYRHVIQRLEELPKIYGKTNLLSHFEAPKTVRVSASRSAGGNEIVLHFVNYNRKEPMARRSPGKGIVDENPLAVDGVKANFYLPPGFTASKVVAISPEEPNQKKLKITFSEGQIKFEVPQFLVYTAVKISLKPQGQP